MRDGAVIVSLSGGVGNQLFQYAAGRTIAGERHMPLHVVGRPSLTSRTLRIQDLLELPSIALTPRERFLSGMPGAALGWVPPSLKLPARRFARRRSRYFVLRQSLLEMAQPKPPLRDSYRYVHLHGFFQHSTYYEPALGGVVDEILARLGDKLEVESGNGVVAMHFRRGDYVTNSYELPMSFHSGALTKLAQEREVARVVVMSDDVAFSALAAEHLRGRGFDVIDLEADARRSDLKSFLTLATAQHVIMSNSTFVWWASVLGDRLRSDDRAVIYPQPWMPRRAAKSLPVDQLDLSRPSWTIYPLCE
jgi:hypothetical protein